MEQSFLSQAEIDALLGGNNDTYESDSGMGQHLYLTPVEQDVLCEIGNINAGSASTALSELLNQRVIMDTPNLRCTSPQEFKDQFAAPYMLVEVQYNVGLEGNNVFVLSVNDAAIIANLMMGGDGKDYSAEMDEITLSAVSEAMNQMIGFSATSLSQIFERTIEISPPIITLVDMEKDEVADNWDIFSDEIAVISFNLQIGDLLQSEIMLIFNIDVAKRQVEYLMGGSAQHTPALTNESSHSPTLAGSVSEKSPALNAESVRIDKSPTPIMPQQIVVEDSNGFINSNNLSLILDIPLRLSVILGKTKRNLTDVLKLSQGSILELERLEHEPVEILVNETLIARGEVVVVKEYFGVRITDIISTESRIKSLVSR